MAAVGGYSTFKVASVWKKFRWVKKQFSHPLVSHRQNWAAAFITPDSRDKRSTTGSKQ